MMEVLTLRIPHVAEQIFEQLDTKSLTNCREVAKSWRNFIDNKNFPWLQIINIPSVLKNGDTILHVAARIGHTEILEVTLENEKIKNPKNVYGETPLHLACYYGHFKIVNLLLQKYNGFYFDLVAEDRFDLTPFQYAYAKNHSDIKRIIHDKLIELKINPNTIKELFMCESVKEHFDSAFFQACSLGHKGKFKMLLKISEGIKNDINKRYSNGMTGLQLACKNGHQEIVEILIHKAVELNLDLNTKDNHGRTAFQLACNNGHKEIIEALTQHPKGGPSKVWGKGGQLPPNFY